jgi:molecular chaperone GrpE
VSNDGKFQTSISEDVINAALKSVDKAKGHEVHVPPPAAPAQGEVEVPIEAAPGEPDPRDKQLEDLKTELDFSTAKGRELMGKVKDEHEKMLRAVADLENFKKRANKEREEVQKFGSEKLLKDFLPVLDNFDRALEHAKTATDLESFKQGIGMVRKLFEDTLGKHGVKAFSAVGKAFDPNFHEAMSQEESSAVPANTVTRELVRGFTLNERLVRPALVVVAKPPAEAPAPPAPPEGTPPQG